MPISGADSVPTPAFWYFHWLTLAPDKLAVKLTSVSDRANQEHFCSP